MAERPSSTLGSKWPNRRQSLRAFAPMATILVTGAAGFIGSHTVDRLLADGHRVVGVDNFRTGHRRNLANALACGAFSLREADVAGPATVGDLAEEFRPEAIVHLAALVGVQESIADPASSFRLNVEATHAVAEAARRHRVPRVVFASSAAVYGDAADLPLRESSPVGRPASPYAAAKLASEALLQAYAAAYGLGVRCLRYFNVFGPRQDPGSPYSGVISIFIRRLREGKPVTIFGDGTQTRDFIFVGDVAGANCLAATLPGSSSVTVNICTGRSTSLLQLLEAFARKGVAVPPPRFASERPGDLRHSVGDPDLARAELGFFSRATLEDGLAKLL